MLNGVFRHVQTNKIRRRIVILPRQGEFGIDKADPELPRPHKTLHVVRALEDPVHAFAVGKVIEECQQLKDLFLPDNLDSGKSCFPLLVNWHNHSTAGNHKRCSNAVVEYSKPSHGGFEVMESW